MLLLLMLVTLQGFLLDTRAIIVRFYSVQPNDIFEFELKTSGLQAKCSIRKPTAAAFYYYSYYTITVLMYFQSMYKSGVHTLFLTPCKDWAQGSVRLTS